MPDFSLGQLRAVLDLGKKLRFDPVAFALDVALDVTDRTQVAEAVRQAEGAVDVLVNNAGHGYRAAVEEADEADVAELFAANFFGRVAMIRRYCPACGLDTTGLSSTSPRSPLAILDRDRPTMRRRNPRSKAYRAASARRSSLSASR